MNHDQAAVLAILGIMLGLLVHGRLLPSTIFTVAALVLYLTGLASLDTVLQ